MKPYLPMSWIIRQALANYLYWQIGREILERQVQQGRGQTLSTDLLAICMRPFRGREAFPART
ncbi:MULTISPECIES: hypothetical protein [unclassified Lysobacter]|uniref:hypothetical protein n=1 Tax=unclassified Lysobacter TaxID=2635362 RepID=UPI00203653AB|nr:MULTISPECIES: hypothetical protein [unclassified Lysobacter]